MVLRIETVAGTVYYIKDKFLMYGAGRVTERSLEMKGISPEVHYGLVFDKSYYGIGDGKIGIIPTSQITRLTIQEKKDEGLALDENIDAALSKRGRK